MTIKFTHSKPRLPCVGDKIEICRGKTSTMIQKKFIGKRGKITAIEHVDERLYKTNIIYTVDIDKEIHYWLLDELKLIK